jgi:anti-sigma regulatory factor (Ser/Thr protein kinase)
MTEYCYEKPYKALHVEKTLSLTNNISGFQQLACTTDDFGSGLLLTQHSIQNGPLALQEVFSYITNHAYDDDRVHSLLLQTNVEYEQLNIEVVDDHRTFIPLLYLQPGIQTPLENSCIGGLGIHIIRHLTDAIEYYRIEGKNTLTLRINLSSDTKG